MFAGVSKDAESVQIKPEGSGPIATAIRVEFDPAKADSDQFIHGLGTSAGAQSVRADSLARPVRTVDGGPPQRPDHLTGR